MRNPQDICLLCKTRNATKTKSHIIPKFIANTIFDGGKSHGYIIDTAKGDQPSKFIQNSAIEDYILCPKCEIYFSIMETYISARVHSRLWDIRKAAQFEDSTNEAGIRRKVCLEASPYIFRLFIYSIVWRCSISSAYGYEKFKLSGKEEEELRSILEIFISATHTEFLNKVSTDYKNVKIFPFIILTAISSDRTKNFVLVNPYKRNPYFVEMAEYALRFSFEKWDVANGIDFLLNSDDSNIKIGFLAEDQWAELMKEYGDYLANITMQNLNANGKRPFIK